MAKAAFIFLPAQNLPALEFPPVLWYNDSVKVSAQLRSRLGQALNDAIRDGASESDWCDPREINRLVDAVAEVLEQCDCRPRPGLEKDCGHA